MFPNRLWFLCYYAQLGSIERRIYPWPSKSLQCDSSSLSNQIRRKISRWYNCQELTPHPLSHPFAPYSSTLQMLSVLVIRQDEQSGRLDYILSEALALRLGHPHRSIAPINLVNVSLWAIAAWRFLRWSDTNLRHSVYVELGTHIVLLPPSTSQLLFLPAMNSRLGRTF